MDDLSGLNWSSNSSQGGTKPPAMHASSNFYPLLRPTPPPKASGPNTPVSAHGSETAGCNGPASKSAQDSFSNLINFGSSKSTAKLSLREQQESLLAEKRKKEEQLRMQAQANYEDGYFLDSLGQRSSGVSRTSSPAVAVGLASETTTGVQNGILTESGDDLFTAFNTNKEVDYAGHFAPPATSRKASPAPAVGPDPRSPSGWNQPRASTNATLNNGGFDDDSDDPFGLNSFKPKSPVRQSSAGYQEDDDFLGDLGKPVNQARRQQQAALRFIACQPELGKIIEDSSSSSDSERAPAPRSDDSFDKAVAQLVDYGFTTENACRGLTESSAGINVQAAANWLLDEAHRKAREKAGPKQAHVAEGRGQEVRASRRQREGRNDDLAWMRDSVLEPSSSRRDTRSPAQGDVDFSKTAATMSTNFLKTANSLWKTGQKKMQKAVADFQQEGDPSQPRWMRSAQQDHSSDRPAKAAGDVTDEVMMLESDGRPSPRPGREVREGPQGRSSSSTRSPALNRAPRSQDSSMPRWKQTSQPSLLDPRSRLNKQAVEEQSLQAYVSPARRKAPPSTQPEAQVLSINSQKEEPDLLFGERVSSRFSTGLSSRSSQPSSEMLMARLSPAARPAPAGPPRQIPHVSATALLSSSQHRLEGTAHFKRGDYAAAHTSYTRSLSDIPASHPTSILLLCNRALTSLKTGEPRRAVDDADTALGLIGPGKGEGEHIEIPGGQNEKRDMKELYGKALSRKAEALEQMEKWSDASIVWQMCVESGMGGPTAIAGRQRCQQALVPKPAAKPVQRRQTASARPKPAAAAQKSSEAVERLRAANAAAEREGHEKFALSDQVDARIAAWRQGKRDNLRALLGSLDAVLWEGSGWKKVGLHELVMANKVKIVYMKAIAKTHPDKISQDASTEVRMIAAIIFSTLNEAWDKFKSENGL